MNDLKKLLVTAFALSLPLSALAQEAAKPAAPAAPLVQVFGRANVNFQYTGAEGATTATANVKPRFGVSIDSSNIGVKGTAELAHGLKAVYQCETQASFDGEDTRAICNRNSRVGISGDFGTVFFGNWDTPYKAGTYGTKAADPFGMTDVYGFNGLMGSPGYGVRSTAMGTSAAANAGFDARAANSVAYWSPTFSGVKGQLQVSVDEFANPTGTIRPLLVSGNVNFDMGGLSVVGQAEYHEDYAGLSRMGNTADTDSKDMAFRIAAGYALPLGVGNLTVMGMFEQLSYAQDNATAGFKSYSRPSYLLGAKYSMGDHEFRVRYSAALKPSITAATGTTLAAGAEDNLAAQNIAVGYAYNLAKSTQVYLYYAQIMNEDAARYTFGVSGNAAVNTTPAGSDPSALGLGIVQSF